ncbi:HD domain-containing protein [Halobacillus mangrovi]|uniref:HD domain-containing protein n=1 Tax=Halobacillus mangrovi TaxID=402384 RepID=UPI003D99D98E
MDQKKALLTIQEYINSYFGTDPSGHDYSHMKRVAQWSKELAQKEGADSFLCEVMGWLHDIGDSKLFDYPEHAKEQLVSLLIELGFTKETIDEILSVMDSVSFRKGQIPCSLPGKIVQDADRLDAMGAIGIARTFAYGGSRGQVIFSENQQTANSIQHFYDKLLKLSTLMNTSAGRQEAERRHQFMLEFLEQFHKETNIQQ